MSTALGPTADSDTLARRYRATVRRGERRLCEQDPMLARLRELYGPCTLEPEWKRTPYEALIRAVIFQQLHGNAARAILGRFVALFPDSGFPRPDVVAGAGDEQLRSVGLSRQKVRYVKEITAAALSGDIPLGRDELSAMGDEQIITRLTPLPGVGRWTVEMLLIATLGRLDVLPVDDFGIRAGFVRAKRRRLPITPAALRKYGERWAPYRSIVAWYLWRR